MAARKITSIRATRKLRNVLLEKRPASTWAEAKSVHPAGRFLSDAESATYELRAKEIAAERESGKVAGSYVEGYVKLLETNAALLHETITKAEKRLARVLTVGTGASVLPDGPVPGSPLAQDIYARAMKVSSATRRIEELLTRLDL